MQFTKSLAQMVLHSVDQASLDAAGAMAYIGAYAMSAMELRRLVLKGTLKFEGETPAYSSFAAALAGETSDTDGFMVIDIAMEEVIDVVDREGKSTIVIPSNDYIVIDMPMDFWLGYWMVVRTDRRPLTWSRSMSFSFNVYQSEAEVTKASEREPGSSVHQITPELINRFKNGRLEE